jgi:hypothetical protein
VRTATLVKQLLTGQRKKALQKWLAEQEEEIPAEVMKSLEEGGTLLDLGPDKKNLDRSSTK